MSDAAQGRRPPPPTFVDHVPVEKIQELAAQNGDAVVAAHILRRAPSGQLGSCNPSRKMRTTELLDIQAFCQRCGGGSDYEIQVKDPLSKQLLIPRFSFKIEGEAKAWFDKELEDQLAGERAADLAARAAAGKPTGQLPPEVAHLPPDQIPPHPQAAGTWYASVPPIDQWRALGSPRYVAADARATQGLFAGPQPQFVGGFPGIPAGMPAPGATAPPPPGASAFSDAIALKQVEEERARAAKIAEENVELRTKLEARDREHTKELQGVLQRLSDIEKKSRDEVHAEQIRGLERKIETLALVPTPKSSIDLVGLATALAAPISGIIVALLESGKSREAAQMQTLLAAMKPASNDNTTEMLKVLGPIIAPLIIKMIDNKSPEAQSKILETMFDAQQNNVALAAQVMQMMTQQAGGENNPWVAIVGQLLAGGGEVLNAYLEEKKRNAREQQQPPRLTHQGVTQPLPPKQPEQAAQPQQPVQVQQPAAPAEPPAMATPEGAAGYGTLDETPAPAAPAAPAEPEHVGVVVDPSEAAHATPTNGAGAEESDEDDGAPMTAEEVVEMFVMHPELPPQFKTQPWRQIVYRLHTGEAEDAPGLVAPEIIKQLTRLEQQGLLPPLLAGWRVTPTSTFNGLVRFLPVQELYPDYAVELVSALVSLMSDDSASDQPS